MTINDDDYAKMKNRIFGYMRKDMINHIKNNEEICKLPMLDELDKNELYDRYGVSKNSFWRNYIIDINKDFKLSDFEDYNYKYMYTPKIFRFNDKYYIEKLRNRNSKGTQDNNLIANISSKLFEKKIDVKLSYQKIYCINENSNYKIKFKYFRYLD